MDQKKKYLLFFLFSFIVGAINGIFGGGGGILAIPVLKKILNLSDKEAHATSVLVISIISVPTLIVYFCTIKFNILHAILVTIGTLIGGVIGSIVLVKINDKTLNLLYILVLILSGIKMFF